jgi:hypothetical protein
LLELELGPDLPDRIYSDALRVQQILVNLLGNAIKFTEQGGVRILVSHRTVSGGAGEISFDVADSGIGIAPADRERVFAPFSHGDPSESRRYGGTGPGLAISLGLAEQLGGKLGARERAGPRLHVPAALAGRGSRRRAARRSASHRPGARHPRTAPALSRPMLHGRVLVAEDGVDNQRLIERLCRASASSLEFASDGARRSHQALAAEREGRGFDVVLMDMCRCLSDGYAAIRALRDAGYAR